MYYRLATYLWYVKGELICHNACPKFGITIYLENGKYMSVIQESWSISDIQAKDVNHIT